MKGWVKEKIGNYAKIIPGYAFNSSDFKEAGIPVVKIANVRNGQVDFSDSATQYVDSFFLKTLDSRYQVKRGDVLVSLTGSHITQPNSVVGRIGRLRSEQIALVNQRAAKFEPRLGICEKGFLYYLLSTATLRKEIALLAHGAANQANVSHKDIEKIKVFWAPFSVQRKIAAVLSAYDDLIENNNKRIAILEKMAEELYREWFVRLRFPGHEKTKIIKGIPEGWEVKKVEDLIERISVGRRYDDKTTFPNGKVPVLDQGRSGVIGFHNDKPGVIASLDEPVIIFANHTCYQKMIFSPFSTIQNVLPFRPNKHLESDIFWLHYATKDLVQLTEYKGHWPEFVGKTIFYPGFEITNEFGLLAKDFWHQILGWKKANTGLILSRDKLLLRLMSGKIDLENLDIQFPASMQEEE